MHIRYIVFFFPLLATLGCNDAEPSPEPRTIDASSAEITAAVHSNAMLSLKLHGELAKQDGNLFYSPLSIEAVLGLLYAGAHGATGDQLAALIDPSADASTFHHGLGTLLADLSGDYPGRGYTLAIASRLFAQSGLQPSAAYTQLAADDYHAPLELLDFADPDAARKTINAWVSQQTAGHIPELFGTSDISRDDALVIANAIYFKASWKTAFDPQATSPQPFHRADGSDVDVPMMSSEHLVGRSGSALGATAVELPYRGGDLALLAIVPGDATPLPKQPDEPMSLSELEAKLVESGLDPVLDALRPDDDISVRLPKLSLHTRIDLQPIMRALGVTDLFDPELADLSAIRADPPLFVSAFAHEAWVQIDESGTEAAAASGVAVQAASAHFPIRFDRPFLFFIRDTVSGAVMFTGRVTDPSP